MYVLYLQSDMCRHACHVFKSIEKVNQLGFNFINNKNVKKQNCFAF